MEPVDDYAEAPVTNKSGDYVVIHQSSHSPLYTAEVKRSNLSDPSLSIKQNSNIEFNTKKLLPPIQLPSKKKAPDSDVDENSENSSSGEEVLTTKLKPKYIKDARVMSGTMREILKVRGLGNVEKELVSVDCQTDMTWINDGEKKQISKTKSTEENVNMIKKDDVRTIMSDKTVLNAPTKQKKAQSSAQIQEESTMNRMSLLHKSAQLVKESELQYRNHLKDAVGLSSDEELESTTTEDFTEEYSRDTLPSIGPPNILQYHRESEEHVLQTLLGQQQSKIDMPDDYVASTGMFEGICEFCHSEVKPFPSIDTQKQLPPEELYCCEQYRDFIGFVIEASKGTGESVLPEKHNGQQISSLSGIKNVKFAKDVAAKRMMERQISKNKAMGVRSLQKPNALPLKMLYGVGSSLNTEMHTMKESARASFQGNALRLSNPASNLMLEQTTGPQFLRQIKTISYQLSSMKCLEEGWTLRPPSPLFDDSSATDYSEIFELDVTSGPWTEHSETSPENNKVIVKYYDDGSLFLIRFQDGSGTIYYPSGRPAINICQGTSASGMLFLIHSDSEESQLSGYFDSRGFAVTYYANDQIRVCLKPLGGVEIGINGAKKRKWRWTDQAEHVHAPPLQPLTYTLSSHLAVRIASRENITLSFTCCKKSCRLSVGAKLKILNSEQTLPPEPTDKTFQMRQDVKQRAKSLLMKISYLLTHPRTPVTIPPLPNQPETPEMEITRAQSVTIRNKPIDKRNTTARNRKDSPPVVVN